MWLARFRSAKVLFNLPHRASRHCLLAHVSVLENYRLLRRFQSGSVCLPFCPFKFSLAEYRETFLCVCVCVRACVLFRGDVAPRYVLNGDSQSLQSFFRLRRQRGKVRRAWRRSGAIRDPQFPKGDKQQWGERLSLSGKVHSERLAITVTRYYIIPRCIIELTARLVARGDKFNCNSARRAALLLPPPAPPPGKVRLSSFRVAANTSER